MRVMRAERGERKRIGEDKKANKEIWFENGRVMNVGHVC